jgi:hypothetical protein
MSERRSSADLGLSAESALGAFPFAERDWESDAHAVEARLSDGARGSTDARLLAAPLPLEPGEPTTLSATSTPLANSGVRTQSLADMARRSVAQKQATERDMARESLALAAQKRPSGEAAAALREAVSAVRAVEAPVTSSSPPPPPRARAARGSLPPVAAAATPAAWSKVGLGAGVLALAAAVFLWLRHPAEPAPLVVNDVAPTAAPDKAQSPTALPPTPAATDHAAAAADPAAVDPSTLTKAGATKAAETARAKTAAGAAAAAPAASASASGPSPEKIVLEDDPPSAAVAEKPSGKPADKPVDKALPPDPALRPADSTGGAIPVKPSSGAVQAALGAVMSGARHCVAGDEDASSAVVVFASDGHVQSVTVHGPAAGKPSGACIEGQLSRARVQPFAAASFSINATVRPD